MQGHGPVIAPRRSPCRAAGAARKAGRRAGAYYTKQTTGSIDDFNKLIHTLGHEYQHVQQRSKDGWRGDGSEAAKGEREFLAYSWELSKDNKLVELGPADTKPTIRKAIKNYDLMTAAKKAEHKETYDDLVALRGRSRSAGRKKK